MAKDLTNPAKSKAAAAEFYRRLTFTRSDKRGGDSRLDLRPDPRTGKVRPVDHGGE